MSLVITITPESNLPAGQHVAKLVDIALVPPNLEKKFNEGIRYTFEVVKGEHAGKRAFRTTDKNIKPNTAAGKFLAQLMGKPLEAGQFDLQSLVGKTYIIQVMPSQNGGFRVETANPFPL